MPKIRKILEMSVFDKAIERMVAVYEAGHRVMVSFSAGKDSGICLEICRIAAKMADRLPVEVVMRDEEIMYPGTFEYAERIAAEPDIDFNWVYACQPIVNAYDRHKPYFWVFDPDLGPDQWVRQPPDFAYRIEHLNIQQITIPARFPPPPGKELYNVMGLRAQESAVRLMGLFQSGGYVTKPNEFGVRGCRPIYDWKDGDVWKAIRDNKWDYNSAYDVMSRLGVRKTMLRIAPPTMNAAGCKSLALAASAWPGWFEKVTHRLDGVRLAVNYGKRAIEPLRRRGETWEACYDRTCLRNAPEWIRPRAQAVKDIVLKRHNGHSPHALPEVAPCMTCMGNMGSWKRLAMAMYHGDPFCLKATFRRKGDKAKGKLPLDYIEPEFFKPGSGTWGGTPNFS